MRNTLGDLNNHLFAQLERLSDEDLKGEDLKEEIERAKTVTQVASKIIENGSLVLNGIRLVNDRMTADTKLPRMLEGGKCTDTDIPQNKKGSLSKMFLDKEM